MTKDEIMNMSAGREMDALIAEKVMRHTVKRDVVMWQEGRTSLEPYSEEFTTLAYYSTDIAAAWEVVEKMAHPPFAWWIESINTSDGVLWFISYWNDEGVDIEVYDKSAPLAICRAALLTTL